MDNVISTYNLDEGTFALCSVKWDDEKNTFIKSDITDIMKCCLKRCELPVDTCLKICNELYSDQIQYLNRCKKSCDVQRFMCKNSCKITPKMWGEETDFIQCAKQHGCWNFNGNDKDIECLTNKQKDVIECCSKNCIPNVDIDCNKQCKFLYDFATKKDEILIDYNQNPEYDYKNNTMRYVLLGIGISTIIIIIWLLRNMKKI